MYERDVEKGEDKKEGEECEGEPPPPELEAELDDGLDDKLAGTNPPK